MIVLGLTGSIGMGKSTAANMLRSLGVPVHEADSTVHDLIKPEGAAYAALCAAFPYFEYPQIYGDKTPHGREIDRKALGAIVFHDEEKRAVLEAVIHPYVQQDQQNFIKAQNRLGVNIVCLDIPLLYETGAEHRVDHVIVLSAPPHIQEERVLARPGMTRERFEAIRAMQMPDGEKCARADFVVQTGLGRAHTMKALKLILKDLQ